jgi:ATP-dependent DNA helicase RecG
LKNFFIQLQLKLKIVQKHKIKGHPFTKVGIILMVLSKSLAFELRSTKRVIKEIRTDMGSNAQMNLFTGM